MSHDLNINAPVPGRLQSLKKKQNHEDQGAIQNTSRKKSTISVRESGKESLSIIKPWKNIAQPQLFLNSTKSL